tara:strand:- start:1629 stop:2432 length:804 start_codon:yes stop_codon:yes gene_type:complete
MSVIDKGDFAGKSLRELIEDRPEEIMGEGYDSSRPFPILVKWLDCSDRLSLQVHPPAEVAPALGGEPKTENWYIADCRPDASLIVGLKNGVTRDEFKRRLGEGTLEECVHRFPVSSGESILVESGRIHAIDAGNLILEIQQNSDTTYRVYDWGRVGLDGSPRQLHLEESLKCIDWNDFEPEAVCPGPGESLLADCREFRLRKVDLGVSSNPVAFKGGEPRLVSVTAGSVQISGKTMANGATVLLPASSSFEVTASDEATILVTDRFV